MTLKSIATGANWRGIVSSQLSRSSLKSRRSRRWGEIELRWIVQSHVPSWRATTINHFPLFSISHLNSFLLAARLFAVVTLNGNWFRAAGAMNCAVCRTDLGSCEQPWLVHFYKLLNENLRKYSPTKNKSRKWDSRHSLKRRVHRKAQLKIVLSLFTAPNSWWSPMSICVHLTLLGFPQRERESRRW